MIFSDSEGVNGLEAGLPRGLKRCKNEGIICSDGRNDLRDELPR